MVAADSTILDKILSSHSAACQLRVVKVTAEELVHVVGSQEPVRDQPDERARLLLAAGWLKIETVELELPDSERANFVTAIQQSARTWLKQAGDSPTPEDRDQVRWLVEKTRSRESKQQIAQRVWLAAVVYNMNHRGIAFDSEGQVLWQAGIAGRIGLSPDDALDLAWQHGDHQVYTASFRQADGTITRGKGRQRWYVYRLTIDSAADPLFERRAKKTHEKVALIVASEIHATQPRLPRDFYGGNEFQQACIDAQDQQFTHILVVSPEHGILSLDDVVPSDSTWDEVLERRVWAWQQLAIQRLGFYFFGDPRIKIPRAKDINWWAWLNPSSSYEISIFGAGFAVRMLLDQLLRYKSRVASSWPEISIAESRPGYNIGDLGDDDDLDFDLDEDFDSQNFEATLQDIDQMLEWAAEFVELVNIFVPPTGETWELAPDEALIPIRLLTETGMDIEDLLDLLTDISLLIEQSIPISMLISANMVVSIMLQITHSLAHNEHEAVHDTLETLPEAVLRQYIEKVLQETSLEDRLCACLTLIEQMHLIVLSVPPVVNDQLLVWLQTYLATKMRQRILGDQDEPPIK
jgi:hypothetical protein